MSREAERKEMTRKLAILSGALVAALALAVWLIGPGERAAGGQVGDALGVQQSIVGSQQQPEPLEIAGRVAQAWTELETFESVVDVTTRVNDDVTTTRSHLWFAQPHSFRMVAIEPPEGIGPGDTTVFDGERLWIYSPDRREARVIEGTPNVMFAGRDPGPLLTTTVQIIQLPEFIMGLALNSDIRTVGEDMVQEREVYVIEAEPRTDRERFGVHRLWVDRENWLPVRLQLNRPDDEAFFDLTFVEFRRNVDLPAELFEFEPPAQATVIREDLSELTISLGWRDVSLDQARQEADFPVLLPTWLPEGMEQRFVRLGTADDRRSVAIVYERDGRDRTILTQHGAEFDTPDLPGSEAIMINGYEGQIQTVRDSTTVTWVQEETRLTLISELPRDEVLEIARSVEEPQQ